MAPKRFVGKSMEEVEINTNSAAATRRVATRLGQELVAPVTLALRGDLGMGKTTFVQGLVAGMRGGSALRVQSPTYALARTYPCQPPVHHLDLYRLEDERAAYDYGLTEMMLDPEAIACVEWPERGESLLPVERVEVIFHGKARRRRLILRFSPSKIRAPQRLADYLRAAQQNPRKKD